MIDLGKRVRIVHRTTGSTKMTGYLRKITSDYYTIQSQKGYMKILPVDTYIMIQDNKKVKLDKNRRKFQLLLEMLDN